jgi:enoyl-CoA hydratase/carnithine racemase
VEVLREAHRTLPATVRVAVLVIEPRTHDPDAWVKLDAEAVAEAADWQSRPDLVSVAVLTGRVAGLGLRVALGCDLRVGTDDVVLAFAAPLGPAHLLGVDVARVHELSPARAAELLLLGADLDAATARSAGLLDVVTPVAVLDATLERLVARLLATDRDVVAETKALLRAARAGRAGIAAAQQAALQRLSSPDEADRAG